MCDCANNAHQKGSEETLVQGSEKRLIEHRHTPEEKSQRKHDDMNHQWKEEGEGSSKTLPTSTEKMVLKHLFPAFFLSFFFFLVLFFLTSRGRNPHHTHTNPDFLMTTTKKKKVSTFSI